MSKDAMNQNSQESSSIDWDAAIKNADNVVLDEDDAPELTEEMMASARPAREVLPEIFPADIIAKIK